MRTPSMSKRIAAIMLIESGPQILSLATARVGDHRPCAEGRFLKRAYFTLVSEGAQAFRRSLTAAPSKSTPHARLARIDEEESLMASSNCKRRRRKESGRGRPAVTNGGTGKHSRRGRS